MAWDTAGNIILDAAVELGLISYQTRLANPDPFAAQDANLGLLCQLLKSSGRELLGEQESGWTHLQFQYEFTTVQGTSQYDLPAGFYRMIPQSGWNRTNRLPLGGGLSPQEWQYLKARLTGVVFTVLFRIEQGKLQLYPDTNTPGGYDIAFEYLSRYWVQPQGQTAPTTDVPSASTDTLCFDPQLLMRGLKLAFLRNRGFDTTSAQQMYLQALSRAKDADGSPPKLSLNTRGLHVRVIDEKNLPITGYGQ